MDWQTAAVALLIGLALGVVITWLALRSDRIRLETDLKAERRMTEEKLKSWEDARTQLTDTFRALSADALRSNNESFLRETTARFENLRTVASADLEKRREAVANLVQPVQETLSKMDGQIRAMEEKREGAYQGLLERIGDLQKSEEQLRSQTSTLVQALRSPNVRGRWGEMQLKRVVEIAGMVAYCDFGQQQTVDTDDGRLRPDLVVRLPGTKNIVVDAKAPLDAFLEAINTQDDEQRRLRMRQHAGHIRKHVTELSKRGYWEQFQPAPEFVVLFLPGECFFSAALEHDPALIEAGVGQRVIVATPTTLISLLKAVAYGWRQESLEENAQKISALGRELHGRLSTMGSHIARLGKQLGSAVDAYNDSVGAHWSPGYW